MIKQALDQNARNRVARDAAARADVELNRVYARLTASWAGKTRTLAALKKAQLAWIAFRSAETEVVGLSFGTGSGQPEVMEGMQGRLTRERVASLLLLLAGPRVLGDGSDLKDADALLNPLWKATLAQLAAEDEAAETRLRAKRLQAQKHWLAFRDAEAALWKELGGRQSAVLARLTWERCGHLNE